LGAFHTKPDTVLFSQTNPRQELLVSVRGSVSDARLFTRSSTGEFVETPNNPNKSTGNSLIFDVPNHMYQDSLVYYFQLTIDGRTYSNHAPQFHYRSHIRWDQNTFQLLASQDANMLLPVGQKMGVSFYMRDLRGQTLSNITPNQIEVSYELSNYNLTRILPDTTHPLKVVLQALAQTGNNQLSVQAIFRGITYQSQLLFRQDSFTIRKARPILPQGPIFAGDQIDLEWIALGDSAVAERFMPEKVSIFPKNAGTLQASTLNISPEFPGTLGIVYEAQDVKDTAYVQVYYRVDSLSPDLLFLDSSNSLALPAKWKQYSPAPALTVQYTPLQTWERQPAGYYLSNGFFQMNLLEKITPSDPAIFRMQPSSQMGSIDFLAGYLENGKLWRTLAIDTATPLDTSATQALLKRSLLKRSQGALIAIDSAGWVLIPAIAHGNPVALVAREVPENIIALQMIPNPFSPYLTAFNDGNTQPGVKIRFYPKSATSAQAIVSIRIYNMAGELVKTLMQEQLQARTYHEIYWNGLSDAGYMLRNGRYLLRYTVRAPQERKASQDIIQPLVLFK
jgi:hypothetical protein